jgi:hypothetical protein
MAETPRIREAIAQLACVNSDLAADAEADLTNLQAEVGRLREQLDAQENLVNSACAALDALAQAKTVHKLAREEYDETAGEWLIPVNDDGSLRCAENCPGCTSRAAIVALIEAVDRVAALGVAAQQDSSPGGTA